MGLLVDRIILPRGFSAGFGYKYLTRIGGGREKLAGYIRTIAPVRPSYVDLSAIT